MESLNLPYETVDPCDNKSVRLASVPCAHPLCEETLDWTTYHCGGARKCMGGYICAVHTIYVLREDKRICSHCGNELKSCAKCAKRGTKGNRHLFCVNPLNPAHECSRIHPSLPQEDPDEDDDEFQ